MVWSASLSWLASRARRRGQVVSRSVPYRPWCEALEDRYLLTTVTTLADSGTGSLRKALTDTPAKGTIDFQPGLSGTIVLKGLLTVSKSVTINGPGPSVITVSGNDVTGVFII